MNKIYLNKGIWKDFCFYDTHDRYVNLNTQEIMHIFLNEKHIFPFKTIEELTAHIINHEMIHHTLLKYFDKNTCISFDTIAYKRKYKDLNLWLW